MAQLPESERRKRVIDMIVGETRYIVPWALWVDVDNECFLNEDFNTSLKASGTVQLKITKVEGGYIAFIHQVSYKWQSQSHHGFFNTNENLCHGKVIGFELNEADKQTPSLQELIRQAIAEEDYMLAAKLQKQMK